ncbi:hypothetical protein [Plantactinospora sp. KLBMP9567]|uniref:hypothetical protein n=1 Tax=Plantactinospora sp. KLBMP9567 TaxID=3085900 RepID=UPI002982871B|nr:hypothetical protein [Plantactinospora sp. KLBMP9567]MDW5327816.1 hypothetical protein [Plantactinospora sp. KLBMP9567]
MSFGLVVAVAATAYLSALGRSASGRRPGPAVLTVGGVLALGVLAMALQVHTVPSMIVGVAPGATTRTPLMGVLSHYSVESLGQTAATSALLLAVLGLLGLGASGLLLATQARIEFDGWRDGAVRPAERTPATRGWWRYARTGLLVVALVSFLGIVGWACAPWLTKVFPGDGVPGNLDTTELLVRSWLPPLIGAVLSVGLAAIAGFGIGAVRPLGRWSELLLLPFAPWLFVGLAPVMLDRGPRILLLLGFDRGLLGLVPLTALSVPALFAFTLLFRAQHPRWRGEDSLGRALLLPALPMLLLAVLLTTLVNAQQANWGWLTGAMPTDAATTLVEYTARRTGELDSGLLSLVLPLPIFLVFLVAFAAIQLGYLDRLAIRVGSSDGATPGATSPDGATPRATSSEDTTSVATDAEPATPAALPAGGRAD